MNNEFNHPLLSFGISFFMLWLTAWVGWSVLRKRLGLEEEAREDFGVRHRQLWPGRDRRGRINTELELSTFPFLLKGGFLGTARAA